MIPEGNRFQHQIYRRLYPLLLNSQQQYCCLAARTRHAFKKTEDILQEKNKCSMDSTSVWQKAHLSDSAISKRKSCSFVNTIRFNILN